MTEPENFSWASRGLNVCLKGQYTKFEKMTDFCHFSFCRACVCVCGGGVGGGGWGAIMVEGKNDPRPLARGRGSFVPKRHPNGSPYSFSLVCILIKQHLISFIEE